MHRKPESCCGNRTGWTYICTFTSRSRRLKLRPPDTYSIRASSCITPQELTSTSEKRPGYIFAVFPVSSRLQQRCIRRDSAVRVAHPSRVSKRTLLTSGRSRRKPSGRSTGWHPGHAPWWRKRHAARWGASSARWREGEGRHSHGRSSRHVWWRKRGHVGGHTAWAWGHVGRREGRHVRWHVGSCRLVRRCNATSRRVDLRPRPMKGGGIPGMPTLVSNPV
jgi:hypothetical protein